MSLYGVRLFHEVKGDILSPIKGIMWDDQIHKALCIDSTVFPVPHRATIPALDCSCGFYAHWTLHHLLNCANRDEGSFAVHSRLPFAIGLVEAFGKIVMHKDGFRSEYMRIVGFLPLITHVHESRFPSGERFLGFPIQIQTRRLELLDSEYMGTFCSELIGVQCVDLKTGNTLLDRSFQDYQ
jgi:hypothetical protein